MRFVFALLLLPSFAIAQTNDSTVFRFKASLDGSQMGEHSFSISNASEGRKIQSSANFAVKVLFITAYRYSHKADELWEGNCLRRLTSTTKENSALTEVRGGQKGEQFILSGPKGEVIGEQCEMTFAYWNPEILSKKKLINPQTGELLDVEIKSMGTEEILVRSKKQQAERYKITAPKTEIDLWYAIENETKKWVALRSVTPEGYVVDYELL